MLIKSWCRYYAHTFSFLFYFYYTKRVDALTYVTSLLRKICFFFPSSFDLFLIDNIFWNKFYLVISERTYFQFFMRELLRRSRYDVFRNFSVIVPFF